MKQRKERRWQWTILCLGLAFGAGAGAHSDEHLAGVPAPHGGQMRMAGALHLELVLEPGVLEENRAVISREFRDAVGNAVTLSFGVHVERGD